jgi:hypothetical protein
VQVSQTGTTTAYWTFNEDFGSPVTSPVEGLELQDNNGTWLQGIAAAVVGTGVLNVAYNPVTGIGSLNAWRVLQPVTGLPKGSLLANGSTGAMIPM